MDIRLFEPELGDDEISGVLQVIKSGWLAMGERCKEFEAVFAERVGVRHAIAVNSCTAALHLSYLLAGVKPGDEVIVPSLTFVATANAAAYCGADVVFADIASDEDWTISPERIAEKITPRTRAVCVMHYAGYACDMDAIQQVARAHNIEVIEDACHGLGGTYGDTALGAVGRIGCFSFYSNKAITTGEGGMLTTNDDEWAARARLLRSHSMTATTYDRIRGAMGYDVVDLGYNYRMDDLRAALGLAQFRRLDAWLEMRHALHARYLANLAGIQGVHLPKHGARGLSAHYILPVIVERGISRDAVRTRLQDQGIQTSIHYPPVHLFQHYHRDGLTLPVTEDVANRALTLPLYPNLTLDQVDRICEALDTTLRQERG